MAKLTFIFLLIFANTYVFADINRPGGAMLLDEKSYQIDLSSFVFKTTGHYDYLGNFVSNANTYFLLNDNQLSLSYGISKKFEIEAMARARYLSSETNLNTTPVALTKFGLESGAIGMKYKFDPINIAHYAIGAHFRQTLYTNPTYTLPSIAPNNSLSLGDSGTEYGLDLYTSFITSAHFRADFSLSFIRPPSNMSQEADYRGEVTYLFKKLGLVGGFDGIYSFNNDPYTSNPANKPQINTGGATALFNSINRQNLTGYLGANYDFGKVLLSAKGGMVFRGVSTDKGYYGLFNLTYVSKGISADVEKIESFKEYHIDGSVLKVSARSVFIKIDQGLSTDVEKGMNFDIYQTDYFGGNVLVATGVVYEVGTDWSVIKLVKRYNDIEIKPGFAARGK